MVHGTSVQSAYTMYIKYGTEMFRSTRHTVQIIRYLLERADYKRSLLGKGRLRVVASIYRSSLDGHSQFR